MLRWGLLAAVVVVLSVAAAALLPMLGGDAYDSRIPVVGAGPIQAGPLPKAVVVGESKAEPFLEHDFGILPQKTDGRHEWTLVNEGEGDLTLTLISSSCSCTIAKLKDGKTAVVRPGESTTIALEWNTKDGNGPYAQNAVIGTSDPTRVQIEFRVLGQVYPAVVMNPPILSYNLGEFGVGQEKSVSFALFSPEKSDLEMTGYKSTRPQFVAEHRPLTDEERKELKLTEGGHKVTIKLEPGLPIGKFTDEVQIFTNHPAAPVQTLTFQGRILGPIEAVPPSIRGGNLFYDRGGEIRQRLVVQDRRAVEFKVASKPFPELVVEIAPELSESGSPEPGRYEMRVIIPPESYKGTINGEIVLETDHPDANIVKIPVYLIVRAQPQGR